MCLNSSVSSAPVSIFRGILSPQEGAQHLSSTQSRKALGREFAELLSLHYSLTIPWRKTDDEVKTRHQAIQADSGFQPSQFSFHPFSDASASVIQHLPGTGRRSGEMESDRREQTQTFPRQRCISLSSPASFPAVRINESIYSGHWLNVKFRDSIHFSEINAKQSLSIFLKHHYRASVSAQAPTHQGGL